MPPLRFALVWGEPMAREDYKMRPAQVASLLGQQQAELNASKKRVQEKNQQNKDQDRIVQVIEKADKVFIIEKVDQLVNGNVTTIQDAVVQRSIIGNDVSEYEAEIQKLKAQVESLEGELNRRDGSDELTQEIIQLTDQFKKDTLEANRQWKRLLNQFTTTHEEDRHG